MQILWSNNTSGVERIVPFMENSVKGIMATITIDDDEDDDDDSGSEDESQTEYVLEISNKKKQNKRIMANMKIQGKIIKVQIYSGSTVNVIPRSIAGDDKLLPCDTDLQS